MWDYSLNWDDLLFEVFRDGSGKEGFTGVDEEHEDEEEQS